MYTKMCPDICDPQISRPGEVCEVHRVVPCSKLTEFTVLTLHLLDGTLNVILK